MICMLLAGLVAFDIALDLWLAYNLTAYRRERSTEELDLLRMGRVRRGP